MKSHSMSSSKPHLCCQPHWQDHSPRPSFHRPVDRYINKGDIDFGILGNLAEHMQVEIEVFGTKVRYFCCRSQGVDWVFASHPSFKRIGLYGDAFGPFQDNQVLTAIPENWDAHDCSFFRVGASVQCIKMKHLQAL